MRTLVGLPMSMLMLTLLVPGRPAIGREPDPPAAETTPAPAPGIRARLTDDVVRQAVRATLAEQPAARTTADGPVLSGDRYESFGRQMDDARVPSCWQPDAMKHQPPKIGPISLGGIFALPFWGAAILSGKCNK